MIGTLLRLVALVATAVTLISFFLFAVDETRAGSEQTLARLEGGQGPKGEAGTNINQADPPPRVERARERRHGDVRELIDDGNDVLVAPFTSISDSDEIWVQRGVPAVLALLLYGVVLTIVAAYVSGGRR